MAEPVYEQIQSPGHHTSRPNNIDFHPGEHEPVQAVSLGQKSLISMTECPAYQVMHY